MVQVVLSDGSISLVDDEDLDLVSQYKWYNKGGYAVSSKMVKRKTTSIRMHRLITNCPKNKVVDHINGNPLDNRKCNLRITTQKGNTANARTPSHNSTGYKGVSYSKRKSAYRSYIKIDQKQYHLGYFQSAEDAANAYNIAAAKHFKEYAKLNTLPQDLEFKGRIIDNELGYKGVSRIKDGFQARIHYKGRSEYLGYFTDIRDAARAYNKAAIKYLGEFALLNEVEE